MQNGNSTELSLILRYHLLKMVFILCLYFHNTIKNLLNMFLYDNIHKVEHLMKMKEQCDKMSFSHPLLLASVYINFWFVIYNIFD